MATGSSHPEGRRGEDEKAGGERRGCVTVAPAPGGHSPRGTPGAIAI
jgi:hypothetical protein